MPIRRRAPTLAFVFIATWPALAGAQATAKPDGVLRALLGVSASVSAGNTRATCVTLTGESVQQTDRSKWGLAGRAFYSRGDSGTTAANLAAGTQYDRDLVGIDFFGVAKLDYLRDRPSNIVSRVSVYGGLGRHLVRNDQNSWDAFLGLGYSADRYVTPALVADEMRLNYGRTEAVLSEASTHKLSATTSARQKIEVYPNLRARGQYRAGLDAGLAVAMTERMQLTTGLLIRYNSDPGGGLKHNDTLFTTGLSVRFD